MGRASLLLCGGFAIIMGVIQWNIHSSQIGQANINVDYANQTQARNMASSGMEIGIKEIIDNGFGWRPESQPWILTINGYDIEVYIDDNVSHPTEVQGNQVRVRSETVIDGRRGNAYAILQRESIFPPVPGAMGFYGEDSRFNMGGNAKVYGFDKNPDNTPGDGEDLPAIASVTAEDTLINRTGEAHEYDGNPPFCQDVGNGDCDLDAQELQTYITSLSEAAIGYTSQSSIGSLDKPEIVILPEETVRIRDNATDAGGVLIIPPNATLELRGTFTFHGLIIVQGTVDIRGNVSIYGAMLFGDNSLLEIEEVSSTEGVATGNTTIQYSSSALAQVDQNLNTAMSNAHIVSISD